MRAMVLVPPLIRDRRGATAVEFGVVGVAFIAMLLFVISLGFRLYVQSALDYAAARAARLLAVNSTQTLSGSSSQFQTASFCPLLSIFVTCANVTIALQPVTDYLHGSTWNGSGSAPFSPGQGGSLMLLQVKYVLPPLSWPLPGPGGGTGTFSSSSILVGYPYQNEY